MGEESHINNSVQFSTLPIPMHCHLETTCTLTLPHRRCTGLVNAVDCNRERQTAGNATKKCLYLYQSLSATKPETSSSCNSWPETCRVKWVPAEIFKIADQIEPWAKINWGFSDMSVPAGVKCRAAWNVIASFLVLFLSESHWWPRHTSAGLSSSTLLSHAVVCGFLSVFIVTQVALGTVSMCTGRHLNKTDITVDNVDLWM